MKKTLMALAVACSAVTSHAKTLIVYYCYTNNIHRIATELKTQTNTDVVRIEPAEEGLDYAANNYALGSALISAIRNHPKDASSYPAIKTVNVNLEEYSTIIVAAPLWWSNMAAPLQTYLFHNGAKMAGKKIGLIVSSASSGIDAVAADARRLIPEGEFLTPNLWIRSSQTSNSRTLIAGWLEQIHYNDLTSGVTAMDSDRPVNMTVTPDAVVVDGTFDSLALYTASGHKMLESSESSIGTSALVPGVYIARVNAKDQSISRKIVINK